MRTLILTLALCLFSTGAVAQCAPAQHIYLGLLGKYGEEKVAGFQKPHPEHPDDLIDWHLWANAETRSWTVFAVMPNGIACIAAVGENFGSQVLARFESMNGGPEPVKGKPL